MKTPLPTIDASTLDEISGGYGMPNFGRRMGYQSSGFHMMGGGFPLFSFPLAFMAAPMAVSYGQPQPRPQQRAAAPQRSPCQGGGNSRDFYGAGGWIGPVAMRPFWLGIG